NEKNNSEETVKLEHDGAAINRIALQKTAQIVKMAGKYRRGSKLGELCASMYIVEVGVVVQQAVLVHEQHLIVYFVAVEHIIRAEPDHIITCGMTDSVIQCGRGSSISLPQIVNVREVWGNPVCVHSGAIVDNDDLIWLPGLVQGALQRLLNIRAILKRNHHGHSWSH
ncbi:hypothetical protein AMQ83_12975, partial [Paenibacillus riograndensis]